MKQSSGPLFLFNVLVGYVCLQLCWWAYLLYVQYEDLYHLKKQLENSSELEQWLQRKHLMIFGEGAVFLSLLLIGVYLTRKSFKHEKKLTIQQNNFLLSVTHELRSPLASVKLQIETLKKHQLDRDKQLEILSSALEDSERLNGLVENILLTTRLDKATPEMSFKDLNVSILTEKIIRSFQQRFDQYHFETRLQKDTMWKTDAMAFQSIITNLLDNAVKYSGKGSIIKISLEAKENLNIIVTDQGIGIPPTERKNIFKKFYRIGNEETRTTKGTGLGLYIVHHLINSLNGTIEIMNGENNQGTSFHIKFRSK